MRHETALLVPFAVRYGDVFGDGLLRDFFGIIRTQRG